MIFKYADETKGAWDSFIKAMQSGDEVEVDEEMYDYWLGVLPPVFMGLVLPFPDPKRPRRYDFGFAEGVELVTVFWRVAARFFCRRTNIMNRGY